MESLSISDVTPPQLESKSDIEIYTFCVPVPLGLDDVSATFSHSTTTDCSLTAPSAVIQATKCVVGTITVMKRSSVFLWIGWGDQEHNQSPSSTSNSSRPLASLPPMGPLVVSMPRFKYIGMSSSSSSSTNGESPCSQLIGGENEDDQMIGWQMASRLSKKFGWPVLVACSLACTGTGTGTMGEGSATIVASDAVSGDISINAAALQAHRAAALGEKEIGRILTDKTILSRA